ncbi:patatin-like phospholipase family protein [Thiolapillus sp.]
MLAKLAAGWLQRRFAVLLQTGTRRLNTTYIVVGLIIPMLLISGCSSIGTIENKPVSRLPVGEDRYSISHYSKDHPAGEILLLLAFSGGGTRAAALSYGVLEELRDTTYQAQGKEVRLLDEVDRISSVSGGSFTSAYYGLFGDRIFEDFKTVFLYKDVQGDLSSQLFGFFNLIRRIFSTISRTEIAVNYYDKHIFRGKTFADIRNTKGPFILINASDLNSRSQFVFIQPQFDFLCSDISRFKVARAVAASSAVPVLFAPILIERHEDCDYQKPAWLSAAEKRAKEQGDQRLQEVVDSLNFYLDKDNPPYATLVDGGITDNLGLRTILRNVGLSGDVKEVYDRTFREEKPRRLVIIVVDASTTGHTNIGRSRVLPSIGDTLTAVTDIQLHLYNTETNSLLKRKLMEWAETLSTPERPITPYFIDLDITAIKDEKERAYFNGIATSFSLEKEQADKLIHTARTLLKENGVYQKLLRDLRARAVVQ